MKKIYCKPNVEAYQINASNIICNSPQKSIGKASIQDEAPTATTNDYWGRSGIWSE